MGLRIMPGLYTVKCDDGVVTMHIGWEAPLSITYSEALNMANKIRSLTQEYNLAAISIHKRCVTENIGSAKCSRDMPVIEKEYDGGVTLTTEASDHSNLLLRGHMMVGKDYIDGFCSYIENSLAKCI